MNSTKVHSLSYISKQKYNRYKILYRGHCYSPNIPHGFGVLLFQKDVYIGGLKHGRKDGYGIWKCRAGYKELYTTQKFKYFEKGIYIGLFKKNNFIRGKIIRYCPQSKRFVKEYFLNKNCIEQVYEDEFARTQIINLSDSKLYRFESISSQIINGFCIDNSFTGNFINMNYYSKFHFLCIYEDSKINNLSVFIRLDDEENVLYKLFVEWKNNIIVRVRSLVDDYNIIYNPISQLDENHIPKEYLCPICIELMTQPYQNEFHQTYQLSNIEKWITMHTYNCRDPMTNQIMENMSLDINLNLQTSIFDYLYKTLCDYSIQGTLLN
tara:strand:- start:1228 stop:2196 length:969 start_codon:yes stop_codon:yes gene_type:complete